MARTNSLASAEPAEPAWKQRAVERSTRAAKLRAEQRVQRFLDAAQAIMTAKGNTDFTVQEVVDRSRQSLRSFYQHFDGKHELLLALFEDALRRATDQIRAAATGQSDPLDRLKVAVQLLFELSRPDPAARSARCSPTSRRSCCSPTRPRSGSPTPRCSDLLTELMTEAERRGRTARRHRAPARRRPDDADGHVHRAVQRRPRRRGRAPAQRRRGLGLLRPRLRRLTARGSAEYRHRPRPPSPHPAAPGERRRHAVRQPLQLAGPLACDNCSLLRREYGFQILGSRRERADGLHTH